MFKRIFIPIAAVSLLLALLLAGCGSDNVDVSVTQGGGKVSKDGLSPLARGKIRRQILDDTQENINVWLKGDTEHLGKAFSKEYLANYKSQIDTLHASGQDKVRIHENTDLEVTELSSNKATINYNFKEKSYFISSATKKVVKELPIKDSQIIIDVVKENSRWKIQLMLGTNDAIL